ncbi:MAG TPA: hypothetical protein VGE41_01545 [Verrucomicrobiae bacterium]
MRFGVSLEIPAAAAVNETPGSIDSRSGKATAVPRPFKNVLRGNCHFFSIKIEIRQWMDDLQGLSLQIDAIELLEVSIKTAQR